MIRVAVVDCGTNTFNLLIAEADAGGWKKIFRSKLPVKLGAGGFAAGNITSSRFIRGIDALYCHHQNIINFDCRHTIAVGTSALREATNAKEFLTYAQRVARLDVEVISGEREASLIYKGVTQTITPSEIPVLVMDIGGGSTEFIIGNKDGILWSKSFLLGVSRLQEMLTPSERFSHRDASQIRQALGAALPELNAALKEFQPAVLIGSSGSFDTLLSLYRYNKKMTEPVALANEIPMSELPAIHAWLAGSTLDERMKHPAIPMVRAEYMPLASFLVKYILEIHTFVKVVQSDYSLKEGVLAEWMETIDWSTVSPQSDRLVPDVDRD